MRATFILCGLAILVAGGGHSAVAQVTNVPPPRVTDAMPGIQNIDQLERERFHRLQTPGGREIDREALADRVAALVDQGKCDEARETARAAGDRAMSRQVGRVCHPQAASDRQ